MKFKKSVLALPIALLTLKSATAHCPLCTVGAAAAAGGALWLGIDKIVVGLFLGAFAASTGWWLGRLIKKKYVPFQHGLIILLSFALTIIPLLPIISSLKPFSVFLWGDYGSLLNRTYVIDAALVSSIFGGLITSVTPWLSKRVSALREGKVYPFQGVAMTLMILLLAGTILQLVV